MTTIAHKKLNKMNEEANIEKFDENISRVMMENDS